MRGAGVRPADSAREDERELKGPHGRDQFDRFVHRQIVAVLALVAAVLVLLIWPLALRKPADHALERQPPVARQPLKTEETLAAANRGAAALPSVTQRSLDEVQEDLDVLLRDAGSAYLSLAQDAAGAFADAYQRYRSLYPAIRSL